MEEETTMATSNSPLAPNAVTDIDSPEVRRHTVPIANIEEPNADSKEGARGGEESSNAPEGDVEQGGVRDGRSSI
jgi:hypothetical protein